MGTSALVSIESLVGWAARPVYEDDGTWPYEEDAELGYCPFQAVDAVDEAAVDCTAVFDAV